MPLYLEYKLHEKKHYILFIINPAILFKTIPKPNTSTQTRTCTDSRHVKFSLEPVLS